MRIFVFVVLALVATYFFGWLGLTVGLLTAFGFSMFSGKRIDVDHSQPFFTNTSAASIEDVHFFELFGSLCKIDGVVSRDEIRGVEVVFNHLGFTPEARDAAITSFNRGKQPDFDFERTLAGVRELNLPTRTAVQLIHLMNVVVANADGSGLVAQERELLFRIGEAFGLSHRLIAEILMLQQPGEGAHGARQAAEPAASALDRAYDTLGLDQDLTPNEMSRSYRKLRSRYHPDKLPRTVSNTDRDAAEKRFTDIQRAWDIVRVHHNI